MKSILNYILENEKEKYMVNTSLTSILNDAHKNKNISKTEMPQIGKVAYDYNDDPWVIKAYCSIDNKIKKNCKNLDDLFNKYDNSGSGKEFIKELDDYDDYDENTIMVGAISKIDGSDECWVWGEEGLSYHDD